MTDARRLPALAGLAAGLAVLALLHLAPAAWRETQRERLFDVLLALAPRPTPADPPPVVVVVDIDAASLAAQGAWPWPREKIAALVSAVARTRPAAIGLDVLLAGPDRSSPAALARRLGEATARADLAALADTLPDGDRAMAQAAEGAPLALGFILDPAGGDPVPPVPVLVRQNGDAPLLVSIWGDSGASGAPEAVATAAAGAGALSLPGDVDGVVRRAPLLVDLGGQLHPGLAAEMLRLAVGASGYILSAGPMLRIGDRERAMAVDAMLRLLPLPAAAPAISASAVLAGDVRGLPAGAMVLIGGSAPELGGLRATPASPLTASVQIQAAAVRQLAVGAAPRRWLSAGVLEAAAAILAIGLGLGAGLLRPAAGVAAALAGLASLAGGATLAASFDRLADPLDPMAAGAGAYLAATLAGFAVTRLREARLRRRFEQHLAPGVVARIVADPGSVKLSGERREITALFTDIEGFTALTRQIGPEQLVSLLDGYFEGMAGVIVAHGGMIDKFVGDAVHAFFNAPVDLPDHAAAAVACARELAAWSESFRRRGLALEVGLGRTRIGVETGVAVVGDVGLGAKLDYTAHGDAVNMAARLESMNKELGTAICIGPRAARQSGRGDLVALGVRDIRGLGAFALFTPPPADVGGGASPD